jgi:hypothetical protein
MTAVIASGRYIKAKKNDTSKSPAIAINMKIHPYYIKFSISIPYPVIFKD